MAITHAWDSTYRFRQIEKRVRHGYAQRMLSRGPGISHFLAAFVEKLPITIVAEGATYEVRISGVVRGGDYQFAFFGFATLIAGKAEATYGGIEGVFYRGVDNGCINFISGPASELGRVRRLLDEAQEDARDENEVASARADVLKAQLDDLYVKYGLDPDDIHGIL